MESTGGNSTDRHYAMLDACRVVAAVGIVWMHSWGYSDHPQIGEAGRFAVPFFAASAMFLMVKGLIARRRSFQAYALRRVWRIYLPFLAWSLIGLIALDAHRIAAHRPIVKLQLFHLYFGSTMQLWFLPFLLIACLALFIPVRAAAHRPRWHATAAIIAIVLGIVCAFSPRIALNPGEPDTDWFGFVSLLQNSWNATPSLFWGMAIAFLIRRDRPRPAIAIVQIAIAIACLAIVIGGSRSAPAENLAGAALLLFCLWIGDGSARRIGGYAFLAYGIYLCHAVFLETIQGAIHPRAALSGPAGEMLIFSATLALSVACCLILHRWKQTLWLLG